MKTKAFDCVAMKRRGAATVQKQLANKSLSQKLAYWQKGTEALKKLQSLKQGKGKSPR